MFDYIYLLFGIVIYLVLGTLYVGECVAGINSAKYVGEACQKFPHLTDTDRPLLHAER